MEQGQEAAFSSDLGKWSGVLLSLEQGYDTKSSGHRLAAQAMTAQPQPLFYFSRSEQKEHCGSVSWTFEIGTTVEKMSP